MTEIIQFDRFRPPYLPVEMLDDNRTIIHVLPPTVELQEELQAKQHELNTLLRGDDEDARAAVWDLAARLISCNRNQRKVSAKDLSKKYGLTEDDLTIFYQKYVDFILALRNAKN